MADLEDLTKWMDRWMDRQTDGKSDIWRWVPHLTRKSVSILPQKVFSFTRKSKFRILDIQILWRHQMRKCKTRNAFYSLSIEFGQFMSYYKTKNFYQKTPSKPEN